MSNVLTHRFVSPKLDGPDLTQVQPSAWNDGHRFVGGAAGEVLTRDPTDATFGATWRRPTVVTQVSVASGSATLADWDPGIVGNTTVFISASGVVDITGLKPAAAPFLGQTVRLVLTAGAPGQLSLYHEHATSTPGSRLRVRVPTAAVVSGFWGFIEFQYAYFAGGPDAFWLHGASGNGLAIL